MKNIFKIAIIIISLVFAVSCATTDCSSCAVVVKPKIMIPNIESCATPPSMEDIRIELKSVYFPVEIQTETELFEIITFNSLIYEKNIKKWEVYYICVDKLIKEKKRLKEALEKTSK